MRLIDADELKKCINDYGIAGFEYSDEERERYVKNMVDSMTTVDPVQHQYWISIRGNTKKCSKCGRRVRWQGENFCPKCGAKMDEKKNETD